MLPSTWKLKMSIPWPQSVQWPTGLQEHATRLKGYLRNALFHLGQYKDTPVQAGQVAAMTSAMVNLLEKVAVAPDLTEVPNKLHVIHMEMNDMKEEMARELAQVRGNIQNMNTNIQEGTNASKEAKKRQKRRWT